MADKEIVAQGETALVRVAPERDDRVQALYNEGQQLRQYAIARIIAGDPDLISATNDLSLIAKVRKALEEKRREYVSPIKAHLDAFNESFKLFTEPLVEADTLIRDKVKAYRAEIERKRVEAAAIEAEKLALAQREAKLNEGGVAGASGAVSSVLAPVPTSVPAPTHIRTEMGTASAFKVRKWEIIDFAAIPDEYKVIDAGKITKLVKAGIGSIPGIRIWEEESLRVRANL